MTVVRRTDARLFAPPAYAHVAIAKGTVYTAGAVPLDVDGNLVGAGDIPAQTRQVIENLVSALGLAGARPEDIVKTTVYVVGADPAPLSAAWEVVRASPLTGAPSTLLGVATLGYTGQLVEIEAIAVIG
jgi:enamine deaminase RidA (YjgF/YER057c/UK114 family)